MAIKKKTEILKKTAGRSAASSPAEGEDEDEDEAGEAEAPKAKVKGEKVEAKANEELVKLVEAYDENVQAAEKAFIDMIEFIQENQVDRATVVASLMKSRGITFEAAQNQYGKMKKIFNNEEVLEELKAGKITLRVAREKTTKKQANPKAAKPEAKEAKFTNSLKNFTNAAKESGFSRNEIMTTVEAELKSAGIK